MKTWLFGVALLCFCSIARAQDAVAPAPAAPVAPVVAPAPVTPPALPSVSGTAMTAAEAAFVLAGASEVLRPETVAALQSAAQDVMVAQAAPKLAAGPWAGKLDLNTMPYPSVYQSFVSLDQAVGMEKHLWSLYKGDVELLRVGVFAGVYKPVLTEPKASPHALAGGTAQVPGSAFDWALGTNYGKKILPALKSAVIAAVDLTRVNNISVRNTFFGVGLSYYH